MQRLAESLIRNRRWWVAGALILLVISLCLASRLSLRHEAADFQPRASPGDSAAPGRGGTDRIVIVLKDLRTLGQGELIDRHLVRQGNESVAISYVYLTRLPWAEGALDQFSTVVMERGGPALAAVRFAGDAVRGATHTSTLKRDIGRSTAIGLALVSLILTVRFRRLSLIGLCLIPIVWGISAALGLMGLLGIELNILTLAIAPLLIGLGVDDGIHMVDRLARGESEERVIRETGPAMTITTLTTIAGFACMGLATFGGVRELGLVAAFGLMVCLLASLHLVPICFGWIHRKAS